MQFLYYCILGMRLVIVDWLYLGVIFGKDVFHGEEGYILLLYITSEPDRLFPAHTS